MAERFILERFTGDKLATVGRLYSPDGHFLSYTLERSWLANTRNRSCIPPNLYELYERTTQKRGAHVGVSGTYPRTHIIFHPGNSHKDTQGCILPVSGYSVKPSGIWGYDSRKANEAVKEAVLGLLRSGCDVQLEVKYFVTVNPSWVFQQI